MVVVVVVGVGVVVVVGGAVVVVVGGVVVVVVVGSESKSVPGRAGRPGAASVGPDGDNSTTNRVNTRIVGPPAVPGLAPRRRRLVVLPVLPRK